MRLQSTSTGESHTGLLLCPRHEVEDRPAFNRMHSCVCLSQPAACPCSVLDGRKQRREGFIEELADRTFPSWQALDMRYDQCVGTFNCEFGGGRCPTCCDAHPHPSILSYPHIFLSSHPLPLILLSPHARCRRTRAGRAGCRIFSALLVLADGSEAQPVRVGGGPDACTGQRGRQAHPVLVPALVRDGASDCSS